jgi:hypothetical protein
MDLVLIPLIIRLLGLVTIEIDLAFVSFTKTLYKAVIYSYQAPSIKKNIITISHKAKDDTKPMIGAAGEPSVSTRQSSYLAKNMRGFQPFLFGLNAVYYLRKV